MKNLSVFLLIFASGLRLTCRAAQFRNLGFDDADTSDLTQAGGRGAAPTVKVLPGWDLYNGPWHYDEIYVNMEFDPTFDWAALRDSEVAGNFALELLRSTANSPPWILEQTGVVPADTQFLTYKRDGDVFLFEVRINGRTLPPVNQRSSLAPYPFIPFPYLIYDFSEFAGKEVKLQFVGPFAVYGGPPVGAVAFIDSVGFYSQRGPFVVTRTPSSSAGQPPRLTFSFPVSAGHNYYVEYRDNVAGSEFWLPLQGAPHNSGSVTDTASGTQRFYRLRISNPPQ